MIKLGRGYIDRARATVRHPFVPGVPILLQAHRTRDGAGEGPTADAPRLLLFLIRVGTPSYRRFTASHIAGGLRYRPRPGSAGKRAGTG